MNKKNIQSEIVIALACTILVVVGDGIYRHFGKGLTITDAFWQILWTYGILFILISIVFGVIMIIYFVSRMTVRKKDKFGKGDSNNKM